MYIVQKFCNKNYPDSNLADLRAPARLGLNRAVSVIYIMCPIRHSDVSSLHCKLEISHSDDQFYRVYVISDLENFVLQHKIRYRSTHVRRFFNFDKVRPIPRVLYMIHCKNS